MNSGNTCNVTVGDWDPGNGTNSVTITTNSNGYYMYYPMPYTGDMLPYDNITVPYNQPVWGRSPAEVYIEKYIKETIIKERGEVIPMKKLYRVFVVSIDEELLLNGRVVVAEDAKNAEFAADVFEVLKKNNLTPKDVTVICEVLGDVKVREEIKKVMVVKED